MAKAPPKQTQRQASRYEKLGRQREVAQLRLAAVPWRAIAERVGISHAQARRDFAAWMSSEYPPEERAAHRRRLAAQIDLIKRAQIPKALGGDTAAAAVVLKALESEVRWFGLAEPARMDVKMVPDEVALQVVDAVKAALAGLPEETRVEAERVVGRHLRLVTDAG